MLGEDSVLDHVAVAVSDLSKAKSFYELLGLKFEDKTEIVASQGVETAFAAIDQTAKLELLYPHGEDGPIHKFLDKKGPGLHHLCFRVKDVKEKTEELKTKGIKLLYEEPVAGAHNCLVNFIHPKSSGGVLIEISTPSKED